MRATGSALPLALKRLVERVPAQPAINAPRIIIALIALFAIIHGVKEYVLDDDAYGFLMQTFAFVPARLSLTLDPDGLADALGGITNPLKLENAKFLLADGSLPWWTLVTHAFLHLNATHLILNSVWLLALGTPVVKRIGSIRFILLFLTTASIGALALYISQPYSFILGFGASAGVLGLNGAALRFTLQPPEQYAGRAEVALHLRPALTLQQLISSGRLLAFVAFFLATLWLLSFIGEGVVSPEGVSIPWEPHAGGFVAGLLLFGWFDRVQRHN
jgi:membrane associated rhomboid family serine protease